MDIEPGGVEYQMAFGTIWGLRILQVCHELPVEYGTYHPGDYVAEDGTLVM